MSERGQRGLLWDRGERIEASVLWVLFAFMGIFLLLPLFVLLLQGFFSPQDGAWTGFSQHVQMLSDPRMLGILLNSLGVALVSALLSTSAAFLFAYGLGRTQMAGIRFFRYIAMLPLYAPTMLFGISVIVLFGSQGLLSSGVLPGLPTFDAPTHGPVGIIAALSLFCLPPALIILTSAMRQSDARLYEASESLGAGPVRTFFAVTLPTLKFGLISAFSLTFILAFTDVGIPLLLPSRDFTLLSVEIYQQVVNRNNNAMGATIALVLLMPAFLAFGADQLAKRRQHAALSAKAVPYRAKPNPLRDRLYFIFCAGLSTLLIVFILTPAFVVFVDTWPASLFNREQLAAFRGVEPSEVKMFSLRHFSAGGTGQAGSPYQTSLWMALGTSLIGTVLVFCTAWVVERSQRLPQMRRGLQLLATLPPAVPGLILGLGYLLFFVQREVFGLPNPLHALHGTLLLLILCNLVHYFGIGYLTVTTALRQIDREFETVSRALGASRGTLIRRVILPVLAPTLAEVALFFFVSTMAGVSAMLFLRTPEFTPATVAIISLEHEGQTQAAAVFALLIVLTNIAARLLYDLVVRATAALRLQSREGVPAPA